MKNFKFILQLVIGFCLLALLIYTRIIKVRLPRNISTSLTIFDVETFFFSFMVIVSCIRVILTIYRYFKTKYSIDNLDNTEEKQPLWLQKKFRLFLNFFKESTYVFYCFSLKNKHIFALNEKVIRCISIWLNGKEGYYLLLIYILHIIPRIIIAFIFLLDIFYFKQLNYFYKSLVLYLIPVMLKSLFVMMEHYYKYMEKLWFSEYLDDLIDEDGIPYLIATDKAPHSYNIFHEIEYPFLKFIGSIAFFGKDYLSELQNTSFGLLGSQIVFMFGWIYLLLHGLNLI